VQTVEACLCGRRQIRAVLHGADEVVDDLGRSLLVDLHGDAGHGLGRLVDRLGVLPREDDRFPLASLARVQADGLVVGNAGVLEGVHVEQVTRLCSDAI